MNPCPRPMALGLLPLVALLNGCGGDAPGPGTVLRDSAGITLARAETPLWTEEAGWRVAEEPAVQIGRMDGPAELLLSDVVGAVRLSDGRIVVADRGSGELRFFGADGGFLLRTGGEGQGPGEFSSLDFVGRLDADSLVTWDGRQRRLQVLAPDGEFVRSFRIQGPVETMVPTLAVGVVGRGRLAMVLADFSRMEEGIVDWPPELLATVDARTGRLDTVARLPGPQASVTAREGGGYSHGSVAFSRDNEYAAGAGRLAVISTEEFVVRVLDTDGRLRQLVRRPVEPRPVTDAEMDELVESIVSLVHPPGTDAPPGEVRRLRAMWRERPRAATVPLLRSVHLDALGNMWVEPYFHMGADPPPFQVFATDGTWLGSVALPPGLVRETHPRRAPAFEIGSDWVLGVWEDELGVQRVRLYPLERR